ncbi:MAG: clan AA aspartic protease [Armatimonadetes bacterium]|nr:clan AA aspartic protease [Armatimonadota bacterium]
MITGSVTAAREAAILLSLCRSDGVDETIEAVIDTGFDGFLTLSPSLIASLELPSYGIREAALADGSMISLRVYEASLKWRDRTRSVQVLETEGGSLAGMPFLYGSRLTMEIIDGGPVAIEGLA